jgi:predicted permease
LLAGAGLAINSFLRMLSVRLGFEPNEVVTMSLGTDKQGLDFYRELLERTQRIPGVESASFATVTPLSGGGIQTPIEIEGRTIAETSPYCLFNIVTPDYFKTLLIALLQGRVFNEDDRAGAPRVAVISRATAEEFWPGENPLGKRIKSPFNTKYKTSEQWIEVAGIVDDVKYDSIDDEVEPVIYLPQWQPTILGDKLIVRVAGDPASAIGNIRSQVSALDKALPVYNVYTMRENIARVTSRYRYSAWLMGAFAALALLLSAMGLYGVMGYTVSARTQEIGIRIALGAQPSNITRLIVIDGVRLIGIGTILGLLAAFLSTRVLKSQLYGVETTDWQTFLLVSLMLVVVALLACYLPARRATKVDPMVALRYE